jgi:integrase
MDTASLEDPEMFPLLFALDRTGLRIGEATALKPEDVDLDKRDLRVCRTRVGTGVQDKPKSKAGERTVDMSLELCDMLDRVMRERKKQIFAEGWRYGADWLFLNPHGRTWTPRLVAKRFKKIIASAKLPKHFTPHSLRHTFARRHLEAGSNLQWLQRQMGHRSMGITNDLYGKWARISDKAAADRLDNGYAKRQGKLEGL